MQNKIRVVTVAVTLLVITGCATITTGTTQTVTMDTPMAQDAKCKLSDQETAAINITRDDFWSAPIEWSSLNVSA